MELSDTSTSHRLTKPSSPAVTRTAFKSVNSTRVMRFWKPVNCWMTSLLWSAESWAILTRLMTGSCAMKGSVESAAICSSMEKDTALQGAWNLKVCRQLPVSTSHSFAVLSDEPVSRRVESTALQAPLVSSVTSETCTTAFCSHEQPLQPRCVCCNLNLEGHNARRSRCSDRANSASHSSRPSSEPHC